MVDGISSIGKIPQNYSQRYDSTEQLTVKDKDNIENLLGEKLDLMGEDQEPVQEVTKDKVDQAVEKLNKTMETYNTELRFQLHEKSGEYMIKIINSKDKSVVREIPPEKVLNMVAYFKEILGLVVDKFA